MKMHRKISDAWKKFLAGERGSESIELALGSTLVLAVVFGIMDCSRAVYINHFLAQAAHDGSRYAMVRGATWTSSCPAYSSSGCIASSSNVSDYLRSTVSPGVAPAQLTVITTWPGTTATGGACSSSSVNNSQGCVVTVQVSYAFVFTLPFLPHNTLNMSSTSAATVLQ